MCIRDRYYNEKNICKVFLKNVVLRESCPLRIQFKKMSEVSEGKKPELLAPGSNGARKNGPREGDTRWEMERLPERPMKIVFTRFLGVQKIPIG